MKHNAAELAACTKDTKSGSKAGCIARADCPTSSLLLRDRTGLVQAVDRNRHPCPTALLAWSPQGRSTKPRVATPDPDRTSRQSAPVRRSERRSRPRGRGRNSSSRSWACRITSVRGRYRRLPGRRLRLQRARSRQALLHASQLMAPTLTCYHSWVTWKGAASGTGSSSRCPRSWVGWHRSRGCVPTPARCRSLRTVESQL